MRTTTAEPIGVNPTLLAAVQIKNQPTATPHITKANHSDRVRKAANPAPAAIREMLLEEACRSNIPPEILMGLAYTESHWRHFDAAGQVLRGKDPDDQGIMQINERAHPHAFPRARTDIRYNIALGAQYLRFQVERYGTWPEAIAAYNHGRVRKNRSGKVFNHVYVQEVLEHAARFRADGVDSDQCPAAQNLATALLPTLKSESP